MKMTFDFNKYSAIGFIIGYFVIAFPFYFWADVSIPNPFNFISKLIWVNLGVFGAILLGFLSASLYQEHKRK